jgi:pimeloyl-ACP methyl ester carboxylesterase
MLNYEAVVTCDAALMPRPVCIVGRGMGALAAMMAARRVEPERLVLIEPWPAEGSGEVEPAGLRPESELALAECRGGIPVPALPERTRATEVPDEGKKTAAAVVQWAG